MVEFGVDSCICGMSHYILNKVTKQKSPATVHRWKPDTRGNKPQEITKHTCFLEKWHTGSSKHCIDFYRSSFFYSEN